MHLGEAQPPHTNGGAVERNAVHGGVPLDDEVVAVPGQAFDPTDHRQAAPDVCRAPVESDGPGRQLQTATEHSAQWGNLVLAAARGVDDLEQLLRGGLADEPVLQRQQRWQPPQHGWGRIAEELTHQVYELVGVLGVGVRQFAQVGGQVVAQGFQPRSLTEAGRGFLEVGSDPHHARDAVPEVAEIHEVLGDGRDAVVTPTPVVHDIRKQVDRSCLPVCLGHEADVLVQDVLREAQRVHLPEGTREHLVPDRGVVEQRVRARDVRAQPEIRDRPGMVEGWPHVVRRDPHDPPAHQVRMGVSQGGDHRLERGRRDDVVGVDKAEVGTGGQVDASVPGPSRSTSRHTDNLQALVPAAPRLEDVSAAIGRLVVDADQLEVTPALSQHGLDRGIKERTRVVDGHHN